MKKFLLSVVAASAVLGASAANPTITQSWTKEIAEIVKADAVNYSTPMSVQTDGSVIATGVFTSEFEFAGYTLSPVATSAYILKYDATGAPKWGVALSGAAQVTAVDTDEAGNIYVAGTLADEVEFGSTDGKSMTKAGMKVEGAYTTKKNASFIAKYTSAGVVEAVQTFVPSYLPSLTSSGMYFPEDGDTYFAVNHLKVSGNKVYASALFTGTTTVGDAKFEGSYYDAFGLGFMYMDMASAAVLSVNSSDLTGCVNEANFQISEPVSMAMERAFSVAFDVMDGNIYAGFVGTGTFKLTMGGTVRSYTFTPDGDTGNNEYGYLIASSTGAYTMTTKTDATHPKDRVTSLIADGGNLYVVGTFENTLPGDETVTANGTSDVFVATLDRAGLVKKDIKAYSWDAGTSPITSGSGDNQTTEDKANYELAASAAKVRNAIYIVADKYDFNENLLGNVGVWFDGTTFSEGPIAASGVASTTDKVAFGQMTAEKVTFSEYTTEAPAGIENVAVSDIRVYPNPVVDVLNFSEPVNVLVYSINGMLVKSASEVTSLDVTDLASGLYIVKAGNKAVRVIKK